VLRTKSTLYKKGRKSKQKESHEETIKRLNHNDEHVPESQRVKPRITKREQLTADLIALFKKRPDVCSEWLLGIRLNLYQKICIRGSWNKRFIIWLMARGLGKSWLGVLFLVLKAILYNDLLLGIVAPTYGQARRNIMDKLEREILRDAPFLVAEYSKFNKSQDDTSITFHNRSRIKAVSSGQDDKSSQRGDRYQILLCDEYCQFKKEIVDRVVNPTMNNVANYRPGMDKSKIVKNQLIIASTSYFRFNHFWQEFKTYLESMLQGDKDYIIFAFPYTIGILVGLYDAVFIAKEKRRLSKEDFDMEYGCQFPALSENSWVKPHDIEKCSDLNRFYFKGDQAYETIMSFDVGVVEGGDNSCIKVGRLLPQKDGSFEVDEVRTVTMNGVSYTRQHETLRTLLKDYPRTIRIMMDVQGVGKGLYQECLKPYWDAELQKELSPLVDMNDKTACNNIINAIKIIYGINGSSELNHNMGIAIKKYFAKHKVHMYNAATSNNDDGILTLEEEAQKFEAEATRREIMKIEAVPQGNYFKFQINKEISGSSTARKDRWSSLNMLLYGVELIEEERNNDDGSDTCWGVTSTFGDK
jgi:hypothetical protein